MNQERLLTFIDQAELVSRAQRADHGAFAELMQRTAGVSLRHATSILRNHNLAEDEVQNAYFKAWQHINQFDGGCLFSTWVSRIVVNQCLMHLRRVRQSKMISIEGAADSLGNVHQLDLADDEANAEVRLSDQGQTVVLYREIGKLPAKLRSALVLRDLHELSTVDAAASLGISVAALKSRLLRARGELRRRLTAGPYLQRQPVCG